MEALASNDRPEIARRTLHYAYYWCAHMNSVTCIENNARQLRCFEQLTCLSLQPSSATCKVSKHACCSRHLSSLVVKVHV